MTTKLQLPFLHSHAHFAARFVAAVILTLGLAACRGDAETPMPIPPAPPTAIVLAATITAVTATAIPAPTSVQTLSTSLPVTATVTVTATRISCAVPPAGWVRFTLQLGDTLSALAWQTGTSVADLRRANCLSDDLIIAGQILYLPALPAPTPTATPEPGGPPANWTIYTVQSGDTLSGLGARFGAGVESLRQANNLEGDTIVAGQGLYVPSGAVAANEPAPLDPGGSNGQVAAVTTTAPDCSVPFTCVNPQLSVLSITPGLPGDAQLCDPSDDTVRIELGQGRGVLSPAADGVYEVTLAVKVTFAACNFPQPDAVRTTISSGGISTDVPTLANPAFAAAQWYPFCDTDTTETYNVVMRDDLGTRKEAVFRVVTPRFKQILVMPLAPQLGIYDVYFCPYTEASNSAITVRLHDGELLPNMNCSPTHFRESTVSINASGVGRLRLHLPIADDTASCYVLETPDFGAVRSVIRLNR